MNVCDEPVMSDDLPEARTPAAPPKWREVLEQRWHHIVWIVPLIMYIPLLSFEFTIGDGPELLIAILNLGGAHPSGYPLLTLLGQIPARFPLGTPHFNVSLMLSALPSALTAWLLFLMMRDLKVNGPVAVLTCWAYAFGQRVMYQSTRIEVYALHNLLLALAFFAMLRYSREPDQPRWYYLSVLAVCLGLTNHLTTAFMIPIVVIMALIVDPRGLFRPKRIAGSLGIAAACASLYLYLPWQGFAQYDSMQSISWNDIRDLKMFWRHVSGEEYDVLRKQVEPFVGLDKVLTDLRDRLFPGVAMLSVLGMIELARRNWRLLLATFLFFAAHITYVSGYTINDIATYYPAAFVPLFLWLALGANWLLEARIPSQFWASKPLKGAILAACFVGCGVMYWLNRRVAYDEQYGEDMGDQAMRVIEEPAIVFTEVDRHTFSMWYEAYVKHPDKEVIPISRGLYAASDRLWYREFLRRKHPHIKWPSEEDIKKNWVTQMMKENPEHNYYVFPWNRWSNGYTYNRVLGWVHELIPRKGNKNPNHREIRYAYMSKHTQIRGRHVFYDSEASYPVGDRLTCVVVWYNDHEKATGKWTIYGPDDTKIEFANHDVPSDSTISWEYLNAKDQKPGKWRCEIEFPNKKREKIVIPFELTE